MAEQNLVEDGRDGGNVRALASARDDKGRAGNRLHELEAVLDGVKRLARFAVETGQFPDEIDIADLHTILTSWQETGSIEPAEVKKIANYYQILERQLGPITARTLKATDTHGDTHYRSTAAGRHAISLWAITGLVVVSIFLLQWYAKSNPVDAKSASGFLGVLANFMLPFIYGSLGSCVYLLRVTEQRLRHRDFDCARIPEHWNRLVLGTLSGGAIVLVMQEGFDITVLGNGAKVTAALLGFLAGYSVDFLFDMIDRILERVLPKGAATAKDQKKLQKKQDAVLSKQAAVLNQMAKAVAQGKGSA
ncbi:MAG: hypothetical protein OEM93_14000 [Rhodospirillales bacterium]|nr:hypothetical protein [Rhodospirillales bacterium]MDH3792705.1 hypothetical protein [Rhodospirillales bacterium]